MKMLKEIFKPFLGAMVLIFVMIFVSGIGPASSIDAQPFLRNTKLNSSDELAAQLPPLLFPQYSLEDDAPQRQGEELPPSTFPKEFDDKSLAGHNGTSFGDKGAITNASKITVSVTKQTPAKKVASEVPDLLSGDAYNRTVYEDGTEGPIQNDTVMVTGPNVISNDKTHEEDVTASSMTRTQSKINDETVSVTGITILSPLTEVVPRNEKNGTSVGDTFTTIPVTEENFAVEDPKENNPISDNNKEKVKIKSDNRKNQNEPINRTDSNTTVKDEPTIRTESNTAVNNETAKPELVSSTVKELSVTEPTSSQPVQQSAITTLQPTLKTQSITSLNISESNSHQKVDDKPLSLAASQQHADHSHASTGKSSAFLQPTESAAILASVFVGIALIGYIGLLIWRRILEKRYGNREMLVNEDDFYDTNDMRNFEVCKYTSF
ncbi:hypothetical protein L798_04814 [Zootermopsis nevadensis]|uniref:Uncharacterized protein n=1 Tax=Zootermopsis nevadensis TaxID=136037 RepID=A0A067RKC8_ZOONE|nr:hypothetical protein L798_04814 [Zootermopsis nevadensis]